MWNMEYGKWNTEYGIRNMEYGIWNTEYGIWNTEYGITVYVRPIAKGASKSASFISISTIYFTLTIHR